MKLVDAASSREVFVMQTVFAVTGTLEEGQIVRLDEPVPLAVGKVRLTVEAVEAKPATSGEAFEKMLRERQRARGHQPRSKEELDAYLRAERASWDD
jgi:hypothetical protein